MLAMLCTYKHTCSGAVKKLNACNVVHIQAYMQWCCEEA